MLITLLAAEKASKNGGSAIFQLVFFGAIFAAMYFLLLRPQRRRVRDAQGLQKSIAEDDEVVLNSGVLGFVSAIDGDIVWLDIADGVEIRVLRSAIARKIDPSKEAAGGQPLADTDEK
ncbi:MAG: preprotein translocase subunit YajC [Ilumatobacteraceae bacterium]|nr:preprotein translocase subunit YajC [Ilumatobacteraceae bacterium]